MTTPVSTGLHEHVPAPEYHAWDCMNVSRLKTLRDKSPAHLRWTLDHPPPPTDAMRLGQAIHTAVLEPTLLGDQFGVCPPRNTKAGKEEAARMKEAGIVPLTKAEMETVHGVQSAIHHHRACRHILDGNAELSAVWKDEQTGLLAKGRFDDTCSWARCIVDLKTTKDGSRDAFQRDSFNLGYHLQAAHYIDGARACGLDVEHFVIIAVEKTPPYAVRVYQLEPDAVQAGRTELARLKDQYARCVETDQWPGPRDDVQLLGLPGWAWKQMERA